MSEVDGLAANVNGLDLQAKKPKQRKRQTDEAFAEQKRQYQESGPKIETENWLYDDKHLASLSNDRKLDRVAMLHACEKAYFMRDYPKCLDLIGKAEVLFGASLHSSESNEALKAVFENSGKKTKKSCKVERHVIELLHIKEKCLAKMS